MTNLLLMFLTGGGTFDGTISIETILTVGGTIIGFIVSWTKLNAKSEDNARQIAENTNMIQDVNRQLQLLSLTMERLNTMSEINEKKWDRKSKD